MNDIADDIVVYPFHGYSKLLCNRLDIIPSYFLDRPFFTHTLIPLFISNSNTNIRSRIVLCVSEALASQPGTYTPLSGIRPGTPVARCQAFLDIFRSHILYIPCLLYTSDAADDLTRVDLG